ncbi:hypothetical protein AGMMS49593_10410 [Endomicrobiia bacterium]|nr:hypothetical protein AGMMS49593_10410 [Endomicrobiia bacterium]
MQFYTKVALAAPNIVHNIEKKCIMHMPADIMDNSVTLLT